MTNCKNCGAPIKGNVCEYCGTRYSDEHYHGQLLFEPEILHPQCRVLRAVVEVPRYAMDKDPDGVSRYAVGVLAQQLADAMKEYMELEHVYDPITMSHKICATSRVLEPGFRF